jgi:hypothetical protein
VDGRVAFSDVVLDEVLLWFRDVQSVTMMQRTFAAFGREPLLEKSIYRWINLCVELWEMIGA